MIHTNRIVTVGEQESIIDRPIVLYRGDREVEIEFTLVGNEFTFSEEGNVIKSVNASHGQLVLNTPSGEHMFSELAECHEGKVVFVVTKEMIDEFIEMGFYSFQIRLYDSAEMKSRVTIPPVMNGFDIRNPIAAEDETNVVDQGIVDYARIFKDQSNEEFPTFDWQGDYNKTEWAHHDVITENKLNKIEDALYSINANVKESDVVMLNTLDQVKKDADKYVKEHMAEVEADVEDFERNLNTGVERFKIDTNAAMTAHKNEVSEELESVNTQLADNTIHSSGYINVKEFGAKGDGVTDDYQAIQNAINYAYSNNIYKIIIPSGWYYLSSNLETRNDTSWDTNGLVINGSGFNTILSRYPKNSKPSLNDISASEDASVLAQEAVFSIYSTKNIISDLKICYSKVGIYIGQDYKDTTNSSYTLFNRFTNIFIQNCGSGIVSRAGGGSYYNNFKNIQIAQGTIGIDIRYPYDGFTDVFNRNNFTDCEINKVFCGVALWNGDTNTFKGVHFEGVGIGYGTKPSWLPDGKAVAIYPTYQLNTFAFCMCEGNTRDVYDDAYGTNYICNHFDMYNGKFVIGSNSNIGTMIGSGAGGMADYFKMAGYVYQPSKLLNPDSEAWTANFTTRVVFNKDAHDANYPLKSYGVIANLTPAPLKVYGDSIFKHKKVCGMNYVWLKVSILVSEENKNANIDLTLPTDVGEGLFNYTYRQGLLMPIFVRGIQTKGRFVDKNKFRIYAPSDGWNIIDEAGRYTDIDIYLTYY